MSSTRLPIQPLVTPVDRVSSTRELCSLSETLRNTPLSTVHHLRPLHAIIQVTRLSLYSFMGYKSCSYLPQNSRPHRPSLLPTYISLSSSQHPHPLNFTMQFSAIFTVLAVASTAFASPSVGPVAARAIEKRASCSIPVYGEALCLAHCLKDSYCDSYCTSK
jgi:hypothetical protein